MSIKNHFEERYKNGDTPWDHSAPDTNLIEIVTQMSLSKGKALDVGCGTGDNAIWLAQQNFKVTGCDISKTAIEKAKQKAYMSNVTCNFINADILKNKIAGRPFDFVFDRGCFHSFEKSLDRKLFAQNVAFHLKKNGFWLTLVGNADEQIRNDGPPQLTAKALITIVEPYYEIITLSSKYFGSNQSTPPKAWVCLMKKRKNHLKISIPLKHMRNGGV